MIDSNVETWEKRLRDAAAAMDYPPTPDIAAGVRHRLAAQRRPRPLQPWYANRLAWAAAVVLLAAAILLAVPQARAAIFEFFQIGDIRIFPAAPTATPAVDEASEFDESIPTLSIAGLEGETTLARLQDELGEALVLPDYPMGIGEPDKLFLQDRVGPIGILVWLETDSVDKPWAVLYILALDQGAFGAKFEVESMQGTMVNGRHAYWVEGRHLLFFYDEAGDALPVITRLVDGNTLIWTVDDVTYRLETVLSLEEAVRMAESMR
jgi:hypothetical protein